MRRVLRPIVADQLDGNAVPREVRLHILDDCHRISLECRKDDVRP